MVIQLHSDVDGISDDRDVDALGDGSGDLTGRGAPGHADDDRTLWQQRGRGGSDELLLRPVALSAVGQGPLVGESER